MVIGAVIVGAGQGQRLGAEAPKCLVRIDGISLLLMAAWPFQKARALEEVVLVVPPGTEDEVRQAVSRTGFTAVRSVVAGGDRRQDSVLAGVKALSSEIDRVLIHDGARPLLSVGLVERLIEALRSAPAVTAALPVADTLHHNVDGYAAPGPERMDLIVAQTPQGFERKLLMEAFQNAEKGCLTTTDEATLVRETMGIQARLIPGEVGNIKITQPGDLTFYNQQLRARAKEIGRPER